MTTGNKEEKIDPQAEADKIRKAAEKHGIRLNPTTVLDLVQQGLRYNRSIGVELANAVAAGIDPHMMLEGRMKRVAAETLSEKAQNVLTRYNQRHAKIIELFSDLESEPSALRKADISPLKTKLDGLWAKREELIHT